MPGLQDWGHRLRNPRRRREAASPRKPIRRQRPLRPQDPEREGYIFLGWEEREDNSQTDDSASGNGTTDNSSDGEDNSGSDAGASDGADDGAGQDDTGSDAGTSDGADGRAGKDDTGSDAGSDDSNGNGAGSDAGQDTTGDGSGQDTDDYFNGFGVVKDIEDDDQIILDAQFAKVYYVAFHDEEGDVIRQGQYQEGATCQTSGVQLTLSDNEEGIDYLKGWSKEADPEKRAENMVGETFSVDENVDLYPVIVRRFLVRFLPYEGFEDDPYAWHYNMPDDQYVEDGKCAEEPKLDSGSESSWKWNGERNGYTFKGWSTVPSILDRKNEKGEPLDPDMDADPQDQPLFDFQNPLNAVDYKDSASRTINLYPVWENGETTTYTVIAMLESVDSDKAVNDKRHKDGTVRYDQNWMSRRVYTAKVGDKITAETPDVKTAMDQFIKDNPGYTYADDPEHDPYKQSVKVTRNGSAEFCVYLDAKVLTLKFYTSYDGKIHWYTNYASGENAGSLNWSSPEEYYNVTIPTATIHARSGEDISKEWPDPKKATISAKPGYKDLGLNPFCWVTKTTYVDRDFEEIQEAPTYFDADENGEVSYYIQFCKDYDKYEWNYYIQKDDVDDWTKDPGNSFEKYETLTDYGSGLTQPKFPPSMNGCTQIDPRNLPDSLKKDSGNVRYLYYARNSYPLYLVSGGKVIGAYESEDNKDASIEEKYGPYKVNGPAIMYGKDISSLMPGSNSCTADLPERPDDVPENYRLAGWKDNEFGTFPTFFHSMSSGTLDLEAVWAPGPVTVTADPGNGEESKTYKLYNNETASNIQTPVREGYTFAGWVTEDGKPFYTYEKVTKDTKIIAQWYKAGQKIKVVYDPGEGTDAPTDDRLYTGGGSFIVGKAPKAPEGKHFSGWKLGEETFRYGDAIEITPGRAALATEAAPASENAAVSTGTAASGNTANATSGNAAETAKHVSAAASSRRAPKAAAPAAQVSVLTLTAVYTDEKPLEPARITYFANNGTDQAYSEQVENNSTYTIKNSEALNFLKAGWYFSGWNTKADGTGTVYKAGDTVGVDNTTDNQLFAQWSKVPVKETEETDEDETEEETEAEAENKTPAHHDTGSGTTEAKPAGTDTSVKTGDQTPVGNYLAYALAALTAAGILVAMRRKREDN